MSETANNIMTQIDDIKNLMNECFLLVISKYPEHISNFQLTCLKYEPNSFCTCLTD